MNRRLKNVTPIAIAIEDGRGFSDMGSSERFRCIVDTGLDNIRDKFNEFDSDSQTDIKNAFTHYVESIENCGEKVFG